METTAARRFAPTKNDATDQYRRCQSPLRRAPKAATARWLVSDVRAVRPVSGAAARREPSWSASRKGGRGSLTRGPSVNLGVFRLRRH
jgi:hypothetical protein